MSKDEQQQEQQKREEEPRKYRVIFDGCNHSAIMTEKELWHDSIIETQFNPAKLIKESVYVCLCVVKTSTLRLNALPPISLKRIL
jgi:hypothetical protein